MKCFKNILSLMVVVMSLAIFSSCNNYNELPPKTDSITSDYLLPKGELPTPIDRAEIDATKAEYAEAVK